MESHLLHTSDFGIEIIDKYADTVWRLCLVYMRNKEDAEDAFQNVFYKLHSACPLFNDDEHVKAWLITVTTNVCKNQLKSFWRKNVISIDQVVSPIKQDRNKEVAKAVMQLPAKYREVLFLHYFEGYKVGELVSLLKSKESTIKTHLRRGRELLKKELIQGGYEYE